MHHGHRRQSSAASEIEVCLIYATTQEIRAAAAKRQIRVLLVWRGVGCGGWRGVSPLRRHSYTGRGHRVELWRISDWPRNDKKQLKVKQSRQTRVCLRFILQKQAQCVLDQWQGSWGAFLDLIIVCTCFWPQTDQVYLFLAASQRKNVATPFSMYSLCAVQQCGHRACILHHLCLG